MATRRTHSLEFKRSAVEASRQAYLRFAIAEHPVNRVAELLPWVVAKQIASPSAASA